MYTLTGKIVMMLGVGLLAFTGRAEASEPAAFGGRCGHQARHSRQPERGPVHRRAEDAAPTIDVRSAFPGDGPGRPDGPHVQAGIRGLHEASRVLTEAQRGQRERSPPADGTPLSGRCPACPGCYWPTSRPRSPFRLPRSSASNPGRIARKKALRTRLTSASPVLTFVPPPAR